MLTPLTFTSDLDSLTTEQLRAEYAQLVTEYKGMGGYGSLKDACVRLFEGTPNSPAQWVRMALLACEFLAESHMEQSAAFGPEDFE